uniref:Uncharacterized protein n=1 Tax=Arundo donax TaxID=35708 RepID=A0A0A8YZT9_ARUDO
MGLEGAATLARFWEPATTKLIPVSHQIKLTHK